MISKRTAEEWNKIFKGKRFTEDAGSFNILKIIKSDEPDYKNQIVAEVINVNDLTKNGKPKKNAKIYDQLLKEILKALLNMK